MKFLINLSLTLILLQMPLALAHIPFGIDRATDTLMIGLERCHNRPSTTRHIRCLERKIENAILELNLARRDRNRGRDLICRHQSFHGKWARGGGCSFHGCWYRGGGCNFHGCWYQGGECTFLGCVIEAPKTKKACID